MVYMDVNVVCLCPWAIAILAQQFMYTILQKFSMCVLLLF